MIKSWLLEFEFMSEGVSVYLNFLIKLFIYSLVIYVAFKLASRLFTIFMPKAKKTVSSNFVLLLIEHKATNAFFFFLSLLIVHEYFVRDLFLDFPLFLDYGSRIIKVYTLYIFFRFLTKTITSFENYLERDPKYQDKPIESFAQLSKILVFIIVFVFMLSVIINRSPIYLLGLLGGASVVLVLAFKDTILGFVASIQLSYNDMVRVGDWISVEKYQADGDVIEINLTTVKVKNFDHTITTVPTYALISESFKNWQGMLESEGRRIKRPVLLSTGSVKFCTDEMIERFKEVDVLKDYMRNMTSEIKALNEASHTNMDILANGFRLTNIGCFRIYIFHYLKKHIFINQNLTCMVRLLEANERGLPLEIYAFSKLKELEKYEQVVSDIFDHLYALLPFFELEAVQNPTTKDFRQKLTIPS